MSEELRFPTNLKLWKYKIERIARKFGLDFYQIMYVTVTAEEMSEVVARSGFPTTVHHWQYGQESLWWKKRFRFGVGRIYEIVINTCPAYAYLLQLNDEITQKSVMAHVPGHVDLNKNNIFFRPTNRDMLNAMASDAMRFESYCDLIGRERVKQFYDSLLPFEHFVDSNSLYIRRVAKPLSEEEQLHQIEQKKIPRRIEPREKLSSYMDEVLNPPEWIEEERSRLEQEVKDTADIERGAVIPPEPVQDILGFLAVKAPLEFWQRNLILMKRRQSYYFRPMMRTKLMHEGWATLWEEEIMTEAGMIYSGELIQFADELAGVQRKDGGLNPYRLGYDLWKDIKFRWDTGRHGNIWEDCDTLSVKSNWDEFAVFKTIFEKHGYDNNQFWLAWAEFSIFLEQLKAGNLGFPREMFVRNHFTREYLIPTWLKYLNAEGEHLKFTKMQEEMESLELQAALLAGKLKDENPKSQEEAELKARHDVYEQAGRLDLWVWTPAEVRRELGAIEKLLAFTTKWKNGEFAGTNIVIPLEWVEWAEKNKTPLELGQGTEKIFEVRCTHDDLMFLEEFFTREFCEEHKYFLYKAKPVWDWTTGEVANHYFIDSRSFRRIKKLLLFKFTNAHLPIIKIRDANFNNNGELYLVHEYSGVDLDFWSKDGMYMVDVLQRLFWLWGSKKPVHLETIVTQKEEEKPWWFTWHQSDEKKTDDDQELKGTLTVFSYGLSSDFELDDDIQDIEERGDELYVMREGEETTFKNPF